MNTPATEPDWAPFAAEICHRLSRTLAVKDRSYGQPTTLIAPEDGPENEPDEEDDEEWVSSAIDDDDEEDEEDDQIADMPVDAAPVPDPEAEPASQLSALQLQLTLRLAATFRDRAAIAQAIAPGAITLITGMTPSEMETLADLLWLGFLPPGCRISRKPMRCQARGHDLLMLYPDSDEDRFSRYALRAFQDRIGEALMLRVPVLILCPEDARLSAELQPYLPEALPLAPVDRGLMLQHLRLAYPETAEVPAPALLAALPDDRQLAGLSTLGLHVALRAPDARTAATVLTRFLNRPAPGSTGAPRLEDMTGDSEALVAVRDLVADLALWQQKKIAWTDLCRSLLLHGQPGTGKTHLARAMGASAGIGFVATSFADWQACGHLGDMLKAMQKIFAEARRQAPAILFIDEIDAAGSRDDGDRHGANYRMQVINGFLQQMDGISRESGVIVIGACNHPERIDPAILRAGRFDLKIEVPLPDKATILGMLRCHLQDRFPEAELTLLARDAVGSSAAEIDAAIRQARAAARREGRDLRLADIRAQCRSSSCGDPDWHRRVAIHECGHAIVAAALGAGTVTGIQLTHMGGVTRRRSDGPLALLGQLESELAIKLAGRAAERLIFGEVSAGSGGDLSSDLGQATNLALSLDTRLGLGAYGPIWLDLPPEIILRDPEARARVLARIEAAETQAYAVLAAHRPHLEAMAEALLQERELAGASLDKWLKPLRGVVEAMGERAECLAG